MKTTFTLRLGSDTKAPWRNVMTLLLRKDRSVMLLAGPHAALLLYLWPLRLKRVGYFLRCYL